MLPENGKCGLVSTLVTAMTYCNSRNRREVYYEVLHQMDSEDTMFYNVHMMIGMRRCSQLERSKQRRCQRRL